MAKGAYNESFAYEYESWLDGQKKWPCLNMDCTGKVDPDEEFQYCSKSCAAKAMMFNGKTVAIRHEAALKVSAKWRDEHCNFIDKGTAQPPRNISPEVTHTRQMPPPPAARNLTAEAFAPMFGW